MKLQIAFRAHLQFYFIFIFSFSMLFNTLACIVSSTKTTGSSTQRTRGSRHRCGMLYGWGVFTTLEYITANHSHSIELEPADESR